MDSLKIDGYYARRSYDNIVLQQPHIVFNGLWLLNEQFYIHCPQSSDPELTAISGKKLTDWIKEYKIIGVPPTILVATVPKGAVEIPHRTIEDIALSKSEPLTILDYERLLLLQLPHDFPFFKIDSEPPKLIYTVERILSDEEQTLLDIAHDTLNTILEPVFRVDENVSRKSPFDSLSPILGHSLHLLNSRYVSIQQKNAGKSIKKLCEEDEDFWFDTKVEIFTKNIQTPFDFVPPDFLSNQSACFIDASVYNPQNIRSYLTLFQKIIINMPLSDNVENFLAGLSITEKELTELVASNKVQFILPQSVDRYDRKFMEMVLDANQNSMLMSRRLAAISIAEIRKRMPLLFPSLDSAERQAVLNEIAQISAEDSDNILFKTLRDNLGLLWLNMVTNIDAQGAMAVSSHGISQIVSEVIKHIHKSDKFLEVYFSTMPLEWAMALQASLIPANPLQENYAGISAAFYSKITNNPKTVPNISSDVLLSKLYMIDNDCPISELLPFCTESITDRFLNIVEHSKKEEIIENISCEVEKINKQILAYEKKVEHLTNYDLLGGLILPLAAKCLPSEYGALEYVGFGAIALHALFTRRIFSPNITDRLRSIPTLIPKDSIFIGRIRKHPLQ